MAKCDSKHLTNFKKVVANCVIIDGFHEFFCRIRAFKKGVRKKIYCIEVLLLFSGYVLLWQDSENPAMLNTSF
jgi:hypothetical protein